MKKKYKSRDKIVSKYTKGARVKLLKKEKKRKYQDQSNQSRSIKRVSKNIKHLNLS